MRKFEVVKKNDEFNDIIKSGKYLRNHFYNIYYKDGNSDYPKFGLAVSKKFGTAVERNKIKRQLRTLIDHNKNLFSKRHNYIIMVRGGVKDLTYQEMEIQLVQLLEKGKFNEKIKIGVLVLLVAMLTACGNSNYIVNDEGTVVEYEATGQILQKDILCKPEDKDLDELYQEYGDQTKIPYEDLPLCSEFSLSSNKADGIWEGIFVKPLAFLIMKLGYLINSFGLSVILIGLAIRLILMPISRKTMRQSSNMKKAQPEIARIEKKYAGKNDNESMLAKSQEMMMVYKKYNISPFGSCLLAFIQLPLFFAFLQAINRTPAIFEDTFFGLTLGQTPMKGLFEYHQWAYLIIIALIILTTYLSFRNSMSTTQTGNQDMERQMQFIFKFMIIMISVASLYLSTAIALYWIATNGFVVLQNFVFKKIDQRNEAKDRIIVPVKNKKKDKKDANKKKGK